jgi:DNA (cytosine-5)-methyltransferase 1
MRHLDLFSGIGGFALAASWVWGDEHEIVSFVEIDPFCQKVLNKHWPDVPIHNDIRTYEHDGTDVDLLTGGYPCQPFSTACHGNHTAEDLSPWMRNICGSVKPRFIVAENVGKKTITDLAAWCRTVGYGAFACRIGADEVGADHKRDRWFCVAHPNDKGELQVTVNEKTSIMRCISHDTWGWKNYARSLWFSDGISGNVARCYGNAIVPQCVVPIMQAIKEIGCAK